MNQKLLDKAIQDMKKINPIYSSLLTSNLQTTWSNKIPSIRLNKTKDSIQAVINPDFFLQLSEQQRVVFLVHELLHLEHQSGMNLIQKKECTCGAKHTSNPNFHLRYCELGK